MLKQRVITAVILAAVFLAVLFFTPWWGFALFSGLVFALAAWEWANLAGFTSTIARSAYALVTALMAVTIAVHSDWFFDEGYLRKILLGSGLWWALALLWVQGYPSSVILWGSRVVRTIMGWLVLMPAWFACLFLKNMNDGEIIVIILVLIVAAADIGAYFAGRNFGKHKLAPNVSPGKTWEGVMGGVLANAVLIAGLMFVLHIPAKDTLFVALIILPAALVSVLGDLLESMVKRHRGVKDSGQLLPGHGGVLDRIDGLVAATPIFLLCLMLLDWHH